MDAPYEPNDPEMLADDFPRRGPVCDSCGVRIPQFACLGRADRLRILKLILEDRQILAIRELRAATGCGLRWAKIGVLHNGEPQSRFPGPPSPFCGAPLPNSRSRQCLKCKADWHGQDLVLQSQPSPPCGALLWTGKAAGSTWFIVSKGRSSPAPGNRESGATESVWLLDVSSDDGYSAQHWWAPTGQILSSTLPGWQSSDIKALKAALGAKERELRRRSS